MKLLILWPLKTFFKICGGKRFNFGIKNMSIINMKDITYMRAYQRSFYDQENLPKFTGVCYKPGLKNKLKQILKYIHSN